ncbi:hypothetical protein [Wenjunlia tyrosinilytica]|uniref:Integral membrane protein n=1 Tax=Wenjunlia tyrosinilytica TaxID=1544741 RepID=A0A918DYG1_9ACTN|nr:hypothetical protein [Wenjunlia tyrosinilytica]GGO90675.1 hypothetical protein GCM10012280_36740 [Wenjunlia tyrosinilytica]
MDQRNFFETPTTYGLHRAEYGLGLIVSLVLFFAHIGDVRWIPAVALFLYIDLIGYIPGAIAYHRSADKRISKAYYVLYNTMHSLVTQGLVALIWIWAAGPEWALLVLPIHLFGDRALFGNFLKPFALHFEPVADPAYLRFRSEFTASVADRDLLVEQLEPRS